MNPVFSPHSKNYNSLKNFFFLFLSVSVLIHFLFLFALLEEEYFFFYVVAKHRFKDFLVDLIVDPVNTNTLLHTHFFPCFSVI